jgi:hypothetical protein
MEGDWSGDEQLHPSRWDPTGGPAFGRLRARAILDGFFVATDYVEERDGRVTYRGHGVYGWDASRERYTMYWFDNAGAGPPAPALGAWEGNVLTFESRTPQGPCRYVYAYEADGRVQFRIQISQDGTHWTTLMEARYARG